MWHSRHREDTGPCNSDRWLAVTGELLLYIDSNQLPYGKPIYMDAGYRADSMFDWHPAGECAYA